LGRGAFPQGYRDSFFKYIWEKLWGREEREGELPQIFILKKGGRGL